MSVDSKHIPFEYYKIDFSGYLHYNGKALTIINVNGVWSTAGIIPPISKASKELESNVEKYTQEHNLQPYHPLPGDFSQTMGEFIYLAKNSHIYMYINNK